MKPTPRSGMIANAVLQFAGRIWRELVVGFGDDFLFFVEGTLLPGG